ncbi:hypothetical protein Tco_1545812, partial [Tanacetum coccineum]
MKLPSLASSKPKPYKFFNFLAKKSMFMDVLQNAWSINVVGHYMFKVVTKLKSLKTPMHKLMHANGNLHKRVKNLRIRAFNEAKLDEERYLKQNAKIDWLEAGDLNSAYFHKTIKSKNSRTRIDVLLESNNNEIIGACVSKAFVTYYESFLGTATDCNPLETKRLFMRMISDTISCDMVRPISDDEISESNGWSVVDNDVCNAVCDFFTNGRQILDNILITQELMHNYHQNRGPPCCAFKVDTQKAYDTVDWHFLERILFCFGFLNTMIKWIMACVSSASFSICINGDVHGFIKGKQGLRQRDPLSPYLFTIVMEVLTLILKRRVSLSECFRFHHQCEELDLIIVFITDDLFIFARGDSNSVRVMMEGLDEFKSTS